jgi:23S rRNA (guanosine2251-2'-O)-methyltransferase
MEEQPQWVTGRQAVLQMVLDQPEYVDIVYVQKNRRKDIQKLIDSCRERQVTYELVSKERLDALTDRKHQGMAARMLQTGLCDVETIWASLDSAPLPVLIALDQVQDQGNVGSLARTAYALGAAGLVVTKNRAAYLGPRAYTASAGALGKLPIARITNMARFLRECQDRFYAPYYAGTDPHCVDAFRSSVAWPAVLVLGNEEKGVRPGVRKECRAGLTIPMLGSFDSLNVSHAGCILLGEMLRQWRSRQGIAPRPGRDG